MMDVQGATMAAGRVDATGLLVLLNDGGPVMWLLFGLSVTVVAISLLKLWQFYRLRLGHALTAVQMLDDWERGRTAQALEKARHFKAPLTQVLALAMSLCQQSDANEALVREEVVREANLQLAQSRSYLKGLEVIAALSPLLGLLGTVLGMIESFQQLQAAGTAVDPALLSGGISEALLTTAGGLVVAIPAVVMLNFFERRIERFRQVMEDGVTRVFTRGLYLPQAGRGQVDMQQTHATVEAVA